MQMLLTEEKYFGSLVSLDLITLKKSVRHAEEGCVNTIGLLFCITPSCIFQADAHLQTLYSAFLILKFSKPVWTFCLDNLSKHLPKVASENGRGLLHKEGVRPVASWGPLAGYGCGGWG